MADRTDGGPAGVVVSQEDARLLTEQRWRIGGNGYVYRVGGNAKGAQTLLHRIVMGATAGQEIHHRNGNKLDNRRENLEITTASEHQRYHRHIVIARNQAARVYPTHGTCKACGREYEKDRDHRGRQTCCSKQCSMSLAIRASMEARRVSA